jgi:hypothetical protein
MGGDVEALALFVLGDAQTDDEVHQLEGDQGDQTRSEDGHAHAPGLTGVWERMSGRR